MFTAFLKRQQRFVGHYFLVAFIGLANLITCEARPQNDLQQTEASLTYPETTDPSQPVETTTAHFLSYLFQREGVRDPWLAQLVKATAPVLAEEGIGGVIRQSFKVGPALALGAFNALANQRIGPLLNLPTIPTTTVIPPYKRNRELNI